MPVAKKFPIHPQHPERICRGSDKYCPVDSMMGGNGSVATPHPSEQYGEDGMSWGQDAREPDRTLPPGTPAAPD